MKVVGVIQKPTLKVVKVGDYEKPVIKVELVIPWTEESWAFVGLNAGYALNIALTPSQVEMFDDVTGEIKAVRP